MAFKDLKQNRAAEFEKIASQFKTTSIEADERIWKPTRDLAGNGLAIIRFLPKPEGEPSPTVRLYYRSFQGPTGKWYIENDLTTLGQDDPVNDFNKSLVGTQKYDDLPKKIKDQLSLQKRKVKFISNIYVIKDANNPQNEGKVFLYEYGKFIRSMIDEKLNPQFEGDERFNPFDLWEGAALKLKITTQDVYPNYKKSEWDKVGPLADDDKMEEIYKQCYPLQEFVSPDKFKSYETLQKKLNDVLGLNSKPKIIPEDSPSSSKTESPPWENSSVDDEDTKFFEQQLEDLD